VSWRGSRGWVGCQAKPADPGVSGRRAWGQGCGVARVSQVQLLQPFITLLASAAALGEAITTETYVFAVLVVAVVAAGRRMPIRKGEAKPPPRPRTDNPHTAQGTSEQP